jgi:hypothetical protein
MNGQEKLNYVLFFMIILVMARLNFTNQKMIITSSNNIKYIRGIDKNNLKLKKTIIYNEKKLNILKSHINNMNIKLKNLTKFIDREDNRKKLK